MIRRNTLQRDMCLAAVQSLKNHATADEIYEMITKDYPSIGRGTVYRNLSILADEGRIRKISSIDGPDRYDHICDEHYHMKCVKCGRIFDVDMDLIEGLEEKIHDKHGMCFQGYQIIFCGVCVQCQKKEAE